jgi:diadenosine tetraphosphate (Ap4A) HIT family hydrolase
VSDRECRACGGEWPSATAFIGECGPANAYLHDDQYFAGWTVVVLKRHVTELYDRERRERAALMDAVSDVAGAVAAVYSAVTPDEQRRRIDTIRARLAR